MNLATPSVRLVDLTDARGYFQRVPLIEIEVVETEDGFEPGLPERIADTVGKVSGARPGSTWVRLRQLERSHYGESGGGIPDEVRPVFVHLLLAKQGEASEVGPMLERVTQAVAETLQSPSENVHVVLAPDGSGRVSFGGNLVQ